MAYGAQMTPVDQINAALKGSVIDVLRPFLPNLAPYTNEEAFNVLLNSPEMTQRSFRLFRDHPDAFIGVVVGPDNQPVANDDEPLSCGRTLTQVVALVVQAVAKRYFRAKLSIRRHVAATPEPSLLARLFGSAHPVPVKKTTKKIPSQGDKLFQAMREHLQFEWQLRLIPHYVGLPLPLVKALGERLLDFKEIEDIQWMVRTGQVLSAPTVRAMDSMAPLHIKADLGSMPIPGPLPQPANDAELDFEHESEAAPKPVVFVEVARSNVDSVDLTPQMVPPGISPERFVAAILGKVNPPLARWLQREMDLNPRQMASMLLRAYESLPASEFQRFGASAPESEEGRRFLAAARTARFGANTTPGRTDEFSRLYLAKVRSLL